VFDACNLAQRIKHAHVKDLIDANKLIKRIQSEKVALKFQHVGEGKLFLVVFSDASLANLPDGSTQGGQIILLMGEDGRFSPLTWSSRRIRRVVRSTLSGETIAMADGIDTGVFLATLIGELTIGRPEPKCIPLICVTDSKSVYEAVRSNKCVSEKRLRLEISGIKELVEDGQIKEVIWTSNENQLADCLTKQGTSPLKLLKTLEEGCIHIM
jgi:hypothetical protein